MAHNVGKCGCFKHPGLIGILNTHIKDKCALRMRYYLSPSILELQNPKNFIKSLK